jgi:hypothetical protein
VKLFPCFRKKTTNTQGVSVTIFPFCDASSPNKRDEYLINQIAIDKPFLAAYNEIGPACDATIEKIASLEYNNEPVYAENLNVQTVRGRFSAYMKMIGKYGDDAPWRTGQDNEVLHPMMATLENLHREWEDHKLATATTTAETPAQRRANLQAAQDVRNAGLYGQAAVASVRSSETGDDEKEEDNPEAYVTPAPRRRNARNESIAAISDLSDNIQERNDHKSQRLEIQRMREANRATKLQNDLVELQNKKEEGRNKK